MTRRRIGTRLFRPAVLLAAAALAGCVVRPLGPAEAPPAPESGSPPREVAAYHLVEDGREQLAMGRTATAIATFQKALALAPSSPHANLALAEAKVRQGEHRAALVYCERVVRLVGERGEWGWRVALIRALAYEGTGDRGRAVAEYRKVLAHIPEHPEALAGLARLAPAATP
jgi:Tfp pilus assembly protein PilF